MIEKLKNKHGFTLVIEMIEDAGKRYFEAEMVSPFGVFRSGSGLKKAIGFNTWSGDFDPELFDSFDGNAFARSFMNLNIRVTDMS